MSQESHQCPSCHNDLLSEHMNIAQGVALCPNCGALTQLVDLLQKRVIHVDDVPEVPAGVRVAGDIYDGQLYVSCRSLGAALGMLFFAVFWNVITGIFTLIELVQIYTLVIGPVPEWFPAPQFENNEGGVGMTIFLCLFLIPFQLIGLATLFGVLSALVGKMEIRIRGAQSYVRTKVLLLRWTKKFDATQVSAVSAGETSYEVNNRKKPLIKIEANRDIKFGTGLTEKRRQWLLDVLTVLLGDDRSAKQRLWSKLKAY